MKRPTIFTLSAISALVCSSLANAANWTFLFVNPDTNPSWRAQVDLLANQVRPRLDGIHGVMSYHDGNTNFFFWFRQDGDGPPVTLDCIRGQNWGPDIQNKLDRSEIALIAFNMENPPCMWVFQKR